MSVTVTISQNFISHVRHLYERSLEFILTRRGVRHGINGYTHFGHSAYVIAVASVETFMNEVFLSSLSRMTHKDSPLWKFDKDWVEKLELSPKLVLVPQLLFGESFERGAQPYQDMALLVKVRNDLVHFKMPFTPPKYLHSLGVRRIALVAHNSEGADYPWPSKLNCSEGIRWAHNTACETVHRLVSFAGENSDHPLLSAVSNFSLIPESEIREWFLRHGIDPESDDPEKRKNNNA
jgi:hypothetical protein